MMVSKATTKRLRQGDSGTISCSICGYVPAIGKAPDGNYYCHLHMIKKYGYIPGVS
jgi:hypothetical protein